MIKPTQEQIAEWVQTANGLDACLALAYAAGRKAAMEEAAQLCERAGFRKHGPGREDSEAFDCSDAIRAAMEADK